MAKRIGELLVERGIIGPDELELALDWARSSRSKLASQLVALGLADEGAVVEVLAALVGVPGVDLSRSAFGLDALDIVPREVAQAEGVLPLGVEGDRLLLAVCDPSNTRALEELSLVSGLSVLPHVALSARLLEVLDAAYAARAKGLQQWRGEAAPPGGPGRRALAVRASPLVTGEAAAPEAVDVELELDDGVDDWDEEELASVRARVGPPVILAVDDEEAILSLVDKTLTAQGYKVERARNGEEALVRVAELMPDLVLLDANLPRVHGFELARKLKADKRFARIPIVIMTAVYRGWRFAHDARESFGVDDYLEKPFRLEELAERVRHQLERVRGEPPKNRAEAEGLLAEGTKLLDQGRGVEAAKVLEKAAKANPLDARVAFQLGRAHHAAGEPYKAIAALERAAELRHDLFAALKALAGLYQAQGFRRKAVEAWERALPAAPDEATRQRIKQNLLKLL